MILKFLVSAVWLPRASKAVTTRLWCPRFSFVAGVKGLVHVAADAPSSEHVKWSVSVSANVKLGCFFRVFFGPWITNAGGGVTSTVKGTATSRSFVGDAVS